MQVSMIQTEGSETRTQKSNWLQSITDIFENLDEINQYSMLKYAEFLQIGLHDTYTDDEEDYWVAEYDKAKAEDDGYRISLDEWRKKHGI